MRNNMAHGYAFEASLYLTSSQGATATARPHVSGSCTCRCISCDYLLLRSTTFMCTFVQSTVQATVVSNQTTRAGYGNGDLFVTRSSSAVFLPFFDVALGFVGDLIQSVGHLSLPGHVFEL
ncbi:hypothetical protein TRVL_01433 [Trypanosoma vivax]|nr:hypothetical protein TRVL_01433 [Trypanosoma vivax]